MIENQSNSWDIFDLQWIEHGYENRLQGFQKLMQIRIRDVLIVSSLYHLYIFEEDGKLYEFIRDEYQGLGLSYTPELTQVSSSSDAVALINSNRRFDMIITTMNIEDDHPLQFAKKIKEINPNIPIVLLAYDNKELQELLQNNDISAFTKVFIWHGDFRLIIAIMKYFEDKSNVDHDTYAYGVQSIIVIEDNPKYYSSFLPLIYTEIIKQSQHLIQEGLNFKHKVLKMRARPKILLCSNYEEAWELYHKYKDLVLGFILDFEFQRNGVSDPSAGVEFTKDVKSRNPDIPILLQSSFPEDEKVANELGVSFLSKGSSTLLHELRQFINDYLGFGDFIFKTPDGSEVGRAHNLRTLEELLRTVPESSIKYHAERNHFSNWLKARKEFWLAHRLRPRKVTDFETIEDLRNDLVNAVNHYRVVRSKGLITNFDKRIFNPELSFARIGGGSIGGKARGLGFINTLITNYNIRNKFKDVVVEIPPSVVIGTDVFDQFIEVNNLKSFAHRSNDDKEITKRFVEAPFFPQEIIDQLIDFLNIIQTPLAVRSSSLLEDSQYHPFAGVYETYMLPNNNPDIKIRLSDLINCIKRVYASTFYKSAKDYIKVTSYRLEEEKMAVLIQKVIGTKHENRFYPAFAGVAKSYNFYPNPPQKSTDGIVSIALGLGKTVIDGGNAIRFCPKYPTDIIQLSTIEEALNNNQLSFYALDLEDNTRNAEDVQDNLVKQYKLNVAEKDGTLVYAGSTYSPEDEAIYDGISRNGYRVVTFMPVLHHKVFPLPQIAELLLDMGIWGMGTPVEMEFAVNMCVPPGKPKEFGLLQMRPMVLTRESEELKIEKVETEKLICSSDKVLGNGIIQNICDIVIVDYHKFDRAKSRLVAKEVGEFNAQLISENKPYLLIGVGRWGTLDPWLGIPITWDQIAGARAIVETGLKGFSVTPSQGSHFFQNITSFMVGYFTVNENGFIDWDWLLSHESFAEKEFTRLLRLNKPITIKINGRRNEGIILKPDN